jgi:methylglyoxal synthase
MSHRQVTSRKRIALVAHDAKKPALLDWATAHSDALAGHDLFATGTTGRMLAERLNRPVEAMLSGPLGGDQQLGAMIAEGRIDVLIFFWDPLTAQPHDPDVKALIRLAVVWNIPVACNESTANHLFGSPLMASEYDRSVPSLGATTTWPRSSES